MPDPVEFTFALPGDWWTVKVDANPEQSIRSYVERQVGRDDRLAAHRGDLRRHLNRALDDARSGGAVAMYFALEIAPGVPFAMTLTTYRPRLPPHLSMEAGPRAASDSLAAWLEQAAPESEVGSVADAEVGVVWERKLSLLTSEDGEQVENLRVDYWILTAESHVPFLMSFASPVIWEEELEPLANLLDAIVESVSWRAVDGTPADSAAAV